MSYLHTNRRGLAQYTALNLSGVLDDIEGVAGKILSTASGVACAVAGNPVGQAAAMSNPATGAGVLVAQGLCPKPKAPPAPKPAPLVMIAPRAGVIVPRSSSSSLPSWALPVGIAAGGVLLVFLFVK